MTPPTASFPPKAEPSIDSDLVDCWKAQQLLLSSQLIFDDSTLPFTVHPSAPPPSDEVAPTDYDVPMLRQLDSSAIRFEGLQYVGGVDISFRESPSSASPADWDAVATAVIVRFPSLELLHTHHLPLRLAQPYIPSFLAFREAPAFLSALRGLRERVPGGEWPGAWMVDGNGRLHERGAGLACVLGAKGGEVTIGVAKKYYAVPLDPVLLPPCEPPEEHPHWRATQHGLKSVSRKTLHTPGDWFGLFNRSGNTYVGAALLPTPKSTNPIFVSPGHRISLASALKLVLACAMHRVPEPVRLADLLGREEVRRLERMGTGEGLERG